MARIRRMLAFLLILTICLSLGEGLAFASGSDEGNAPPAAVGGEGDTVSEPPASGEQTEPGPEVTAEPAPEVTDMPEAEATETPVPEATETPVPEATETPVPEATETPVPEATETPVPEATETPVPEVTETPVPEATETPVPEVTETPVPEATEAPEPEATDTPEPEATAVPAPKEWPWTEPGNTVAAILEGGKTLTDGDITYRSEDGLWANDTLLANVNAANLNLSKGMLYYSDGSAVCRMPAAGGAAETVFTAAEKVEQMYVMGQEIRYLAKGTVYSYDMRDGMTETLPAPDGVTGLAPTEYGNLFLTGDGSSHTLWAEQIQLLSGVERCATEDGRLIVTIGGESYQTGLSALFMGAVDLQAYDQQLSSEAEPEVSAEPEAVPETSAEPEAAPEVSTEPEAVPETSAEPEAVPETSAEPKAMPETSTEPEAEPETSTEPEAVPETSAEPEAEPEASTEPEAVPEASAEPEAVEAVPETSEEPEAVPETSAEPEAAPETSEEPEATPETTEDPEASPEASEEPQHKQWPWTEPGAPAASILSGGRYLTVDGVTYYSEGGLWAGSTFLSTADGKNLNLSDNMLYYSAGSAICRVPTGSSNAAEVVYNADNVVEQMYVMGQEVRYLSNGAVYSYDMENGTVEQLEAPAGVTGFIPTQYGNLYLTGDYFNYTLWAEQIQLRSGIDSCKPDGDWLVVVAGGETYQTSLPALFEGSINLQTYTLHQGSVGGSGLSDEQQLANEAAYLQSAEYAALTDGLTEYGDSGIMTASTSHVRSKSLTTNQQNIVLRAQQMADVTWKCLVDRYSWGGNDGSYTSSSIYNSTVKDVNGNTSIGKFLAGRTYRGVPYSQAVSTGYVGWGISLSDFLSNTKVKDSIFYKSYSDFSRLAPYYGSDCSGFASYAWDLPIRCTCTSMLNYSTYIPYTGLADLQVGDTLNNPSSHVVLITDLGYDNSGNIVSVEVTEQTPPKMKVTCYGEAITGRTYNYTGTLRDFQSYFSTGYSLYRRSCASRPSVRRPADVADLNMAESPVMTIAAAGPAQATVTLTHKDASAKIYYTINGAAPTVNSTQYSKPFTVTASADATKVTIQAMAVVGGKNSFPLSEELEVSTPPTLAVKGDASGSGVFQTVEGNKTIYYVKSGATLTLQANSDATIYYTTDGSEPTRKSSSGKSGEISIKAKADLVVKAFAESKDSIPSAVTDFTVGLGNMFKITVDDPFGFMTPSGSEHMVLQGETITFRISKEIGSYKLKDIKLDGESQGVQDRLEIKSIDKDHTITVEVDTGYVDVRSSAWYGPAVAYTTQKGLFYGTKKVGDSQYFSPNDMVTRAMFITVLGRFAKPSLYVSGARIDDWEKVTTRIGVTQGSDINIRSGPATTFNPPVGTLQASGQYVYVPDAKMNGDVKWYYIQYNSKGDKGYISSVYYGKTLIDVCEFGDITGANTTSVNYSYGYAQWAYLNDIVNGTSASTFNPKGYISRQDVCVMIYNYLTKYLNKTLNTSGDLSKYSDSSRVASYAADAVKAMVNIGVIEGKPQTGGGTNLNPTMATSRAEVATIFMRLDKYLNG